jgi:hypothetical protein
MTPDDLAAVDRSWADLQDHVGPLVSRLAVAFGEFSTPEDALARAHRLLESTNELVGLLDTPSRLAARARALADMWPDGAPTPCFGIDGRAWMRAASEVNPTWSADDEVAWRRAWLLLSDVLAEDSLSPF